MVDIFISRPTWISGEFQEGLAGFISFLDTHDIKPRTLGSTDYPTESPLDEVNTIMDECKGVIVLGYPQIYVVKGKIKETENSGFILPTEWNHIEANLAYLKKMPLLIIHHKGISRGIFEHGAISKFIHEKDLSTPNWFLSDDIKGALKKWKASLKVTQSKASPVEAKRTYEPFVFPPPKTTKVISSPTKPSLPQTPKNLDAEVEHILIYFFNEDNPDLRCEASIIKNFRCNHQATIYYIKVLLNHKMIEPSGRAYYHGKLEDCYSLTPKGREYIMVNKLSSFGPPPTSVPNL